MISLTKSQKSIALWALLLGLLASQVAQGHLHAVDQDLARMAASWHSHTLDVLMRAAAFFGSSVWTVLALGSLMALAWSRERRRHMAWILAAACGFGLGVEVVLRFTVAQWRPDTLVIPTGSSLIERFNAAGFPSGHVFRSAFLLGWIMKELRPRRDAWARAAHVFCAVLIVLVGVGRLYLSRHWASDVLGGWLVALLALSIASSWERVFGTRA